MRRVGWAVALLFAAAGAAGKAGSRRPRGVGVNLAGFGELLVIALAGGWLVKNHPVLGRPVGNSTRSSDGWSPERGLRVWGA